MISPHDEVTLKRVIHEALNERERHSTFDIFEAIEQVRQAYSPLMSLEERQRMRADETMRPLDAQLADLERQAAVVFPTGVEAEIDRISQHAFLLMRDYRRMTKIAREQGHADIAERCIAQGERIERILS